MEFIEYLEFFLILRFGSIIKRAGHNRSKPFIRQFSNGLSLLCVLTPIKIALISERKIWVNFLE